MKRSSSSRRKGPNLSMYI